MYHGVSGERSRGFRDFVVTPSAFEQQMERLAERGLRGCTVSELVDSRSDVESRPTEHLVGLTFDDAFRELVRFAVPVLERLGFGATIYVPTGYIGGTSGWLGRIGEGSRPVLDADRLRELTDRNVECGAHGHSHVALDVVPLSEARREVEISKKLLEDTIEREVSTFAYPFGYESLAVRRLVESAGYRSACRVNYSMSPSSEDVFALSRLPVRGDTTLEEFTSLFEGGESLLWPRLRARAWRPVRRSLGRIHRAGRS